MPSDADGAAPLAGQWAADGGEVDLADLFLGDEPVPAPKPVGDHSVHVTSLVVGHLPVIAAPWISQHARDSARTIAAPVAVLSRSGDRTTLDLYNAPPLSEQHTIEGAIDQVEGGIIFATATSHDALGAFDAQVEQLCATTETLANAVVKKHPQFAKAAA